MARRVTLRELEHFVALAEHGSVTGAAAAIGLSQPAMSTSLRDLETTLGLTLLLRHRGRGVSLLPEGEVLLSEARSVLARAAEMEGRMSDVASVSSGRLVVGSLVTVSPIVVPALVRSFRERHPGVDVDMWTGTQVELLAWLRTGAIHVAVTYDMGLGSDVDFQRVLDATPHALLAADHRLAGAESVDLADLVDDPFVLLDLPISREYFTSLFLAADLAFQPASWTRDLSLVRSLVGNGFGYSLVNLLPATDIAQDGSAVAHVELRTSVRPLGLGLARRRDDRPLRSLEAFAAFAREALELPRGPAEQET